MESRQRTELLASLSPESRATYEILRAQLVCDLDWSFAESNARLQKAMAATAPTTPAASEAPTTNWAATAVLAASTANTSTPAMVSAPSVAAPDSTSPRVQAVTATAPTAPAVSVDLSLKRNIDHLVGGSTTPASNPSDVITAATPTPTRNTSSTACWVAASVGAATASAPSTMGLGHNSDREDPTAESMSTGTMHTSIGSSSEDSPSPALEPWIVLEQVRMPPLTCSVECSASNIRPSSPAFSTTCATPRVLEPAATSTLSLELTVQAQVQPSIVSTVPVHEDTLDTDDTYGMEVFMAMEDMPLTTSAPLEGLPTHSMQLFIDRGFHTSAPTRRSTKSFSDNTEVIILVHTLDMTSRIKQQGQTFRLAPWSPSEDKALVSIHFMLAELESSSVSTLLNLDNVVVVPREEQGN
ncbi:mucin-5AC [Triticum aestivum]|uniref:mucin-5AC n=1 Tax=Triticum aestivum TaxID=4565 RepID=UPI001D00C40D|nr:mucin-5AC-like [Triticum aestivum]